MDGAACLDDLLERHPAALPAGARGPRDARGHLDLQRLLLGPDPDDTGDKRPITSALNNLKASSSPTTTSSPRASIIVALPTLIVFFVLQKQFIGGLTLGSTKG